MYATPTKNPCTNPTMGTNLIRVPKRNMISRATTNGRAKNNSMDALPRRQEQSLSAGIGKVLAVDGTRGAERDFRTSSCGGLCPHRARPEPSFVSTSVGSLNDSGENN